MLTSVRKAYLNVDSRTNPLSRQGSRTLDFSEGEAAWSSIRHLTNEERDQIDLQARVILQRCSTRVKEMEALEKRAYISLDCQCHLRVTTVLITSCFAGLDMIPQLHTAYHIFHYWDPLGRAELVASKVNPLLRLLPARLREDESTLSSGVLAAHRSSITWYLSRRLAETSQLQKDMQEERVKRQLDRAKSLATGATREANSLLEPPRVPPPPSVAQTSSSSSWLGDATSGILAATLGVDDSLRNSPSQPSVPIDSSYPSEDSDDDDIELSQSQILQFEAENAALLRNVQDQLESVHQAEARLSEISALQMELVTHLTQQTELTDQLFEDAIATTSTVEKGKAELIKAQQRGKDGRLFLLVFLFGASFSLLFLHYY
jgi:syntaxin 18